MTENLKFENEFPSGARNGGRQHKLLKLVGHVCQQVRFFLFHFFRHFFTAFDLRPVRNFLCKVVHHIYCTNHKNLYKITYFHRA